MGATAKLEQLPAGRRAGVPRRNARLRGLTQDDVNRALQRLREQGRTRVAYKELVAEVLAEPRVAAGTWLDDTVLVDDGSHDDRVLQALQRLVVDQPALSPWAEAIGATFTSAQVRPILNLNSRQALHNWVKRGKVLAITTADGEQLFPAWQFVAGGNVVEGLDAVMAVLSSDVVDRWTLASWLRRPLPDLEGTSVADALLAGYVEPALTQARRAASRWSR